MRIQQAFRLPQELIDRLKKSAGLNFRNLTQEVEFRLEDSLKRNPSGAANALGMDQSDTTEPTNDNSTP